MLYKYTRKPQVSYLANFTSSSRLRMIAKISLPKVGGRALTQAAFGTSQPNLVFMHDGRVIPPSQQDTLHLPPHSRRATSPKSTAPPPHFPSHDRRALTRTAQAHVPRLRTNRAPTPSTMHHTFHPCSFLQSVALLALRLPPETFVR